MNNTLHTPAPWKHDSTWGIIKYGKTEICALHSGNLANAHLISAAPDLLSALESAYNAIAWDIPGGNLSDQEEEALLDVIRAAIAKAKGKA
jgi:hypothetical protein